MTKATSAEYVSLKDYCTTLRVPPSIARCQLKRWATSNGYHDNFQCQFYIRAQQIDGEYFVHPMWMETLVSARAMIAAGGSCLYTEEMLQTYAIPLVPAICRDMGLPEPDNLQYEHRLNTGKRLDMFSQNIDGSYSIFEVKSFRDSCYNYEAVGQLLYYAEMVDDQYERYPHLFLLSNRLNDRHTQRVIGRLTCNLVYVDLLEYMRRAG